MLAARRAAFIPLKRSAPPVRRDVVAEPVLRCTTATGAVGGVAGFSALEVSMRTMSGMAVEAGGINGNCSSPGIAPCAAVAVPVPPASTGEANGEQDCELPIDWSACMLTVVVVPDLIAENPAAVQVASELSVALFAPCFIDSATLTAAETAASALILRRLCDAYDSAAEAAASATAAIAASATACAASDSATAVAAAACAAADSLFRAATLASEALSLRLLD